LRKVRKPACGVASSCHSSPMRERCQRLTGALILGGGSEAKPSAKANLRTLARLPLHLFLTTNSTQLGDQKLSQWLGSRDNYGSTDHADILLSKAGGEGGRPGDYLYTAFVPVQGSQGPWGIFRVGASGGGGGGTDGAGPINGACPQTPVQPSQATPTPKQPDIERFLRRPLNTTPRP